MRAACLLIASLTPAVALAQTPKPAASPTPAPAPAATAPKSAAAPAAPQPSAPAATAAPSAAPARLSQSKFISLLYAEIARHTPQENTAGPGEVRASFRVGAQGKVDKITIEQSSSPKHAEIVKAALGKVQAPPPPDGVFEAGQTFKFR